MLLWSAVIVIAIVLVWCIASCSHNISVLYDMLGQLREEQGEIEAKLYKIERKLISCVTDEDLREAKNDLVEDIEIIRDFILSHYEE